MYIVVAAVTMNMFMKKTYCDAMLLHDFDNNSVSVEHIIHGGITLNLYLRKLFKMMIYQTGVKLELLIQYIRKENQSLNLKV